MWPARGHKSLEKSLQLAKFSLLIPRILKQKRGFPRSFSRMSTTVSNGEALIGAIDQGTSSSRFLVFAAATGNLVTAHQIELKQNFPREGWVELDPEEILLSTKTCINEVYNRLIEANLEPKNVKAIGVTNQRETTIVWDAQTGRSLYPAVVWLDTRAADLARRLDRGCASDWIRRLSGLPIHSYFSALKLRWLMENVQEIETAIKNGTAMAGTVDSWLIWHLTGGADGGSFVTDVSNASRTLLMDLKERQWSLRLCDFFQIPSTVLPEIRSSSEVYGHLKGDGEAFDGVPVAGCLGDQQAALLGQACLRAGEAKNTYGTGCFLLCNTGQTPIFSSQGLVTTVAFQLGPQEPVFYALEGSIAVAGAGVRWLRDNLNLIQESDEVERLAKSVSSAHGVYFVPAFSGLFAPHWDSSARGAIFGLSQYSTKAHVARAVLEAVCFQTREILELVVQESGVRLSSLQVDGGMTKNDLLMQTQADILGMAVHRTEMAETTALGAAVAAGLAVKVWELESLRKNAPESQVFQPLLNEKERNEGFMKWKEAVRRSMHWVVEPATHRDQPRVSSVPESSRRATGRHWSFSALLVSFFAGAFVTGLALRKG